MFKHHASTYVVLLGFVVLLLLTIALAVAASIIAGRRLWTWSRRLDAANIRRISLRIAAVILTVHGIAALFLPLLCDLQGGVPAIAALWINAALPWLLAAGFLTEKKTRECFFHRPAPEAPN